MAPPLTLLLDNGSLEPAATLRLRQIAAVLAEKIGVPVAPVSLLHSAAVPAEALGGTLAEVFASALERRLVAGNDVFHIVPLFFGPSRALTDYLPERVVQLRARWSALRVRLAPPLYQEGDGRLAQLLADQVQETVRQRELRAPWRVALVDHGSPARGVTAVRDALASQLAGLLGPECQVAAASMERREGPKFDFNEPLLEKLLRTPGWNHGDVILAMQFLLPGRHAGWEGDVAGICRAAESVSPGLRTHLSALVGEHAGLTEILADRWRAPGLEL